jgi:hypothetical protein
MLMLGYLQLSQESVTAYVNHVKPHWRQGGWNQQKHEEVMYDSVWAGIPNFLKNNIGHLMPGFHRLDCSNKVFDKAAASHVTPVEHKKPAQQQHVPPKQQQTQPTD